MWEPRTARAFGMVWMEAVEMKILHNVGWSDVNACIKSIVLETDIHIHESCVYSGEGSSELDGEDVIEVLQECYQ